MIKSIDHILVAVEDLDKAVEDYSLVFGFGPTSVSYTHLTLPTTGSV